MEAAGAEMVERTADDGAMGLGALSKAMTVRGTISRLKRWFRQYRVIGHVPVDSPAANFPIAKVMHAGGARVIHLAAPQLWAWAPWRARKLRACTDLVLCLLPFERNWFAQRKIPARFIGHPILSRSLDDADLARRASALPRGGPRLLLLPGSRSAEVQRNIRLLHDAFVELQGRHAGATGLIVAANADLARIARRRVPVFPTGLSMGIGGAGEAGEEQRLPLEAAIRWCDLAIAVSGSVTLDLVRQHKPMVGVYKAGLLSVIGAKVLLTTPHRLLPNIIAGRRIVPEFVPWAGGCGPIVNAAAELLRDSRNLAHQAEELARIAKAYEGRTPEVEAAEAINEVLGTRPSRLS